MFAIDDQTICHINTSIRITSLFEFGIRTQIYRYESGGLFQQNHIAISALYIHTFLPQHRSHNTLHKRLSNVYRDSSIRMKSVRHTDESWFTSVRFYVLY